MSDINLVAEETEKELRIEKNNENTNSYNPEEKENDSEVQQAETEVNVNGNISVNDKEKEGEKININKSNTEEEEKGNMADQEENLQIKNNNTSDDDLMDKINKEAENVRNSIPVGNNDLNIFHKYDHMDETQLKKTCKEKNKEILSLSKDQELYKTELSHLIDQLNEAIEKSTSLLLKKPNNPQNMENFKHIIQIRQKELQNTKNQIKIYRQQYELLNVKANERFSVEKMNEMEEQIANFKKENSELTKKVRVLKNTQIIQSKELEVWNMNKKHPNKINAHTEEVKNLVAKKHEYFNKLNKNKKSMVNLRSYLARISKTFKEVLFNPKYNTNGKQSETLIKGIEEELSRINEEMKGSDEEILERVCVMPSYTSKNTNANSILLRAQMSKRNNLPSVTNKSKSPKALKSFLPAISNPFDRKSPTHYSSQSPKKEYKGIFNKYEYFTTKERKTLPNYMVKKKPSPGTKNKSQPSPKKNDPIDETQNENSEDFKEEDDHTAIEIDYDNTFDSDYNALLKKKDQLDRINTKIEKNIKEIEKLYEKKFKDLTNSLDHNQKKVKLMQQQNELLSVEIADLSKIIKLNLEENKLKKEIKESESKIFKTLNNNPLNGSSFAGNMQNHLHTNANNTHNDVSVTRQDILQELNNILGPDGEKGGKHRSNLNVNANTIEEEHAETNSILENQEDNDNGENNENKNLKFPDISNVEHIEEDTEINRRDKKLSDIRNKYISIDNDINFTERIIDQN